MKVEPTACMDRSFMSMLIILYIFYEKTQSPISPNFTYNREEINVDLLTDACSRGVDWIVFKTQDFLFFTV